MSGLAAIRAIVPMSRCSGCVSELVELAGIHMPDELVLALACRL